MTVILTGCLGGGSGLPPCGTLGFSVPIEVRKRRLSPTMNGRSSFPAGRTDRISSYAGIALGDDRRPSEVASKIQAGGLIRYSRGVIKVLDLNALKAMSCECYETLRERNGH